MGDSPVVLSAAKDKHSEASLCPSSQILRCAQDDIVRSLKLMLITADLSALAGFSAIQINK
jgi:hypothetical protein